MDDNFLETANAMLESAITLHTESQYRQACYLAGYVVECSIKELLVKAKQAPSELHTHNLNSLMLSAQAIKGRHAKYRKAVSEIFQAATLITEKLDGGDTHWDPFYRYDGTRWNDSSVAGTYIAEAQKVKEIFDRFESDF